MNQCVMEYLGFDDINIMFHDPEKNILYKITFGEDEENAIKTMEKLKRAKTEKEKQDILDKEAMRDVVLNANRMIFYPVHLGITSIVFKKQKTVVINNFGGSSQFDFVNEIDNPKGIQNINNVMIGAMTREDGTTNGIIQLFNTSGHVTQFDRRKFDAISRFFGGCVEKLEDSMKKLTTIVAVEMQKTEAKVAVESCLHFVEDNTLATYANLLKPLE